MSDDTPETFNFDSTAIMSATYSPRDRSLAIMFTGGRTKTYTDVEPAVWTEWKNAPSAGNFFNSVIRGKYAGA